MYPHILEKRAAAIKMLHRKGTFLAQYHMASNAW
jgi:hypothetical protein